MAAPAAVGGPPRHRRRRVRPYDGRHRGATVPHWRSARGVAIASDRGVLDRACWRPDRGWLLAAWSRSSCFAAAGRRRHRVERGRRRSGGRALRRGGAAGTAPLPGPAGRPAPPGPGLGARPGAVPCAARRVRRLRVRHHGGAAAARPSPTSSVPSTARFVDAFAEAQALETDALPAEHARAGVRRRRRPGRTGLARRPRRRRTHPALRALARRARHRRAGDQAAHHRPRLRQRPRAPAAYARARSELAKLDRAGRDPPAAPATAALDAAAPRRPAAASSDAASRPAVPRSVTSAIRPCRGRRRAPRRRRSRRPGRRRPGCSRSPGSAPTMSVA